MKDCIDLYLELKECADECHNKIMSGAYVGIAFFINVTNAPL